MRSAILLMFYYHTTDDEEVVYSTANPAAFQFRICIFLLVPFIDINPVIANHDFKN
jgi:hypothetical protein